MARSADASKLGTRIGASVARKHPRRLAYDKDFFARSVGTMVVAGQTQAEVTGQCQTGRKALVDAGLLVPDEPTAQS